MFLAGGEVARLAEADSVDGRPLSSHRSNAVQQREGWVAVGAVVADDRAIVLRREGGAIGEDVEPRCPPLALRLFAGGRPEMGQPSGDARGFRIVQIVVGDHVHAWGDRSLPECVAIPRDHAASGGGGDQQVEAVHVRRFCRYCSGGGVQGE